MHQTTITGFFQLPAASLPIIDALIAAAGITGFTYTDFEPTPTSWTFTANRALTSAEQTALAAAIMASLVTVTSS